MNSRNISLAILCACLCACNMRPAAIDGIAKPPALKETIPQAAAAKGRPWKVRTLGWSFLTNAQERNNLIVERNPATGYELILFSGEKGVNEDSALNAAIYGKTVKDLGEIAAGVDKVNARTGVKNNQINAAAGVKNNRIDAKDAAGAFAPAPLQP